MTFDATKLKAGDRIYTYVWAGAEEATPLPLTVIRVNQKTITTDRGRIPHEDVIGYWREQTFGFENAKITL